MAFRRGPVPLTGRVARGHKSAIKKSEAAGSKKRKVKLARVARRKRWI